MSSGALKHLRSRPFLFYSILHDLSILFMCSLSCERPKRVRLKPVRRSGFSIETTECHNRKESTTLLVPAGKLQRGLEGLPFALNRLYLVPEGARLSLARRRENFVARQIRRVWASLRGGRRSGRDALAADLIAPIILLPGSPCANIRVLAFGMTQRR